jgi:hypothetical protein
MFIRESIKVDTEAGLLAALVHTKSFKAMFRALLMSVGCRIQCLWLVNNTNIPRRDKIKSILKSSKSNQSNQIQQCLPSGAAIGGNIRPLAFS